MRNPNSSRRGRGDNSLVRFSISMTPQGRELLRRIATTRTRGNASVAVEYLVAASAAGDPRIDKGWRTAALNLATAIGIRFAERPPRSAANK